MSQLSFWLSAQILWLVMAVVYNIVGIYRVYRGGRALVGERDQPLHSLMSLPVFALPILVGFLSLEVLYCYTAPIILLLLGRLGFWRHIEAARSPAGMKAYSSSAAWWWAVIINGYGSLVLAIGLLIAWSTYLSSPV
ncbi:hypothetical protein HBA55_01035 [Pseudomaricurvus alkylphenolicus]|uniref:hypothetical protein n=1 Tax=Pseudomaricurvus alkylphenolicus TaxID=1306991 RepID=UPI00141EE47B|nr:hypothetical protein [Pseudomaricurvus alkylphenolicus]NIB38146.1 hypothetical protein [Pseudomaricurvus alkylphenolicus]